LGQCPQAGASRASFGPAGVGHRAKPFSLGQSLTRHESLVQANPVQNAFQCLRGGIARALATRSSGKPVQGNARSLPKHLQKPISTEPERRSIVLAGVEAHVCLLQTALDLLEEEWEVWVVTDACSSRTERNRDAAYDRLAGAGAELVTTEMVLFEWLRSAEHPQFKEVQAFIK